MANYLGKQPGEVKEGRQAILYGPPFSGKTTLLANCGMKVLLGDMDHNTSPLDNADNVTIFRIVAFDEYLTFKEGARDGYIVLEGVKHDLSGFDLICLDSFTRFEEIVKRHVLKTFAPNRKRELKDKFGAQSDWQDLQDIEVEEVRDWQAMTRTHGFSVIWLGHDMTVVDSMNVPTHLQLALQGKYASPRIMGAVDALMYMMKTTSRTDKGDIVVQRVIYTQDHQMIKAEARMPTEKRIKMPTAIPVDKRNLGQIFTYLGHTGLTEK